MAHFPTLRLVNKFREVGGYWYADMIELKHYSELHAYRQAEPQMDWHLETRGLSTDWHRFEPSLSAFSGIVID